MPNSTSAREARAVGGKEFGRSGGLRESILANSCMSNCFGASPINFISSLTIRAHLAMLLKGSFPSRCGCTVRIMFFVHLYLLMSFWILRPVPACHGLLLKCASLELDLAVVLLHKPGETLAHTSGYSASSRESFANCIMKANSQMFHLAGFDEEDICSCWNIHSSFATN